MRKFLVFILVFIAFFLIRMVYFQYLYFEEGKKLKSLERIKNYEKVILHHFPLSPYTNYAVNEVLKICEELKEDDEKLYCYETLRSSLIQIRSFYQPYQKTIQEIKPHIASLTAVAMINWKENGYTKADYERLYEINLKLLIHENTPSLFWSAISVFSFLGWIGFVFLIIFKGFERSINKKHLLSGVFGFIVFFFLWIIGLYMA